ncbi:MAG: sterol desaturase/sphingolipid hydroxylase (fatty acid hydroxylase superfamily) [Bacteroidia bacterium]|jgi:sterol desaturase/sphingolipid hydroxylase (fatty acid hydroxylase superfamily)
MRELIRHFVFPATLVAALFLAHALLASGTAPQAVIVIWFGLMPFVALLERLLPRHPQWNRSHNDIATDVIYFPVSLLVAGGLSALWGGFHIVLATELQEAVGSPVWPSAWPLALQVVLACVAVELFAYWGHRLMHEVPLLWRFHSIHHSPKRVYWLNAIRAHPGEHVFRGFISSIPLAVLGAPPEILAYWMVLSRVGGLFQHANIDFVLGPFAWIFSIGELHRWHHSTVRAEADHNYGDTFIIWDTVFGTRYLPRNRPAPREVGISDLDTFPTSWWGQQLAPFRYSKIERESRGTEK